MLLLLLLLLLLLYYTAVKTLIDEDVQLQNFGVHTPWGKAKDRDIGIESSVRQRSVRSSPLSRKALKPNRL